ncbi:MAG: S9 family peptidase [Gemmataceae bacterium]|nr:S9 family peptidase [Gemmataceae bacterium]
MRRVRFTKQRMLLAALALAVGVIAVLAYGWSERPKQRPSPVDLQLLDQPRPEYAVLDGAVIDASTAPANETPTAQGAPGKVDALDIQKAYQRAERLAAQTKGRVFKDKITPHWFGDKTRFWYRNDLRGGAREFILVDADKGKRERAFDHDKLAAALSQASGNKYQGSRLPFDAIEFVDQGTAVRFQAGGARWQCSLTTYECTRVKDAAPELEELHEPRRNADVDAEYGHTTPVSEEETPFWEDDEPQQKKKGFGKKGFGKPPEREPRSPDGKWTALLKDNNVYLKDKDGVETQLTQNGVAGDAYGNLSWSPDSKTLLAYRTIPGDRKEVYMIESSPKDQLPAKLHTRVYPRPGDKFDMHEMWLIDVETKKPIQVETERIDAFKGTPRPRWRKDGSRFTFEKTDRGHQRFRIIEVDARTGKTRDIYDEKAETFVDSYSYKYLQYLDDTDEILLTSERDGWKHLYVIDAGQGKIKYRVTKGEYVIRGVDRVDEKNRQIWFRASGKNAGQDPYFIHYYRVDFDGSDLVALTEGNGTHTIEYSPDRKYLIDTYSRVDMPPVHELRRVSDGTLVCELDKADVTALADTGWRVPEVFVAKGRDGKTDIWGIVCRPQNFDESKKYPVIEYIYAGPQGSFVPKSFSAYRQMAALAELGFIVVQCDGMGTANRSRAFHDVCWKNLADAGFPDRILWIKALAKNYSYVDISRVGNYGTSAGGQNSTGALLFHPEFYKVAVSSCGCHDNRLDKWNWNEQWMGLAGAHYEKQSNVTNAHKLQGKLLLIVGELDTNVPFESTLRVADALIKARKDFDLIFVPGMGHSNGGAYGDRRQKDFFVRHLLGVEPPDRNSVAVAAGS